MAYVNPGEVRHEIRLIRVNRTISDNNHYEDRESSFTARAAVRAVNAKDLVKYGADQEQETLQFIVRWHNRKKITGETEVEWRGRRYAIFYIDPTPWAELWCRIKAVALDGGGGEWMDG